MPPIYKYWSEQSREQEALITMVFGQVLLN